MRNLLLILAIVATLAVFGCAQSGEQAPKAGGTPAVAAPQAAAPHPPSPIINATPKDIQNKTPSLNMTTRARNGYVNRSEVGGEGLIVISAWKPSTAVMQDGSFTTEVSAIGAQLVALADKDKKLRAMAISLPEDAAPLVFDAKSTTKASMWIGGSTNQSVGEQAMAIMEKLDCYPALYGYIRTNLKQKNFAEIADFSNKEYVGIQMNCTNQILGMAGLNAPN